MVDLEFHCKKIFLWFTSTIKIKIMTYSFQQIIFTVSTFLYTVLQHSLLYCARRPYLRYPQVTHGKRMATFRSVSNELSVFTATICAYSVLCFSFTCVQFANSCVVATNAASCLYSTFYQHAQSHSRSLNLGTQNQFYTIKKFS